MSIYGGSGGLVATAADSAEPVNYRATCGNVIRTGQMTPNDDGIVAMLLEGDLTCDEEDGTFELGPIMDGGWFWLHMGANSAIGGLVADAVLMNDTSEITDSGNVTMTEGSGAVLLTHTSGRVGILSTILPEPTAPEVEAAICGPRYSAQTETYSLQASTDCWLGDGGTKIRLTGPAAHGRRAVITDGTVTRYKVGDFEVTADLWVNETGSISTSDPLTPALGWAGKDSDGTNWLNTRWGLGLITRMEPLYGSALTPAAAISLTNDGGTAIGANPNGQGVITISPSSTYCPDTGTQHTATLRIVAVPAAGDTPGQLPAISPPLEFNGLMGSGAVSETHLRVVCPPR